MSLIPTRFLVGAVLSLALAAPAAHAARELTSDRPDTTESPYTVEPGRWQLETSLVEYLHDHSNVERLPITVTGWAVAPMNFRVGLTTNTEVQFVVEPWLSEHQHDRRSGSRGRVEDVGDVTVRYKWNLWGNDEGDSALAVMPFVKVPLSAGNAGNDHFEGGLIVPFGASLPGGWGFGAMTEVDFVRNEDNTGYETLWLNTMTVSHDIAGDLGGFLELAVEVGPGAPAHTFNAGLTYGVNDDLQLDLGVNVGLNRAADDVVVFTGLVKRF